MNNNFCDVCKKEVETNIQQREEIYNVKGEEIKVNTNVRVCCECGNAIFDEQLDQQTLVSVYNEYRIRKSLLMPEEIKNIREMYGLSQRAFANLLNFGDRTINRYENGGLQDQAHNSLLRLLSEPKNMKKYIETTGFNLSLKQIEKLEKRIEDLLEEKTGACILEDITRDYSGRGPDVFNGFKNFDIDKFRNIVLFFVEKCKVYKVKLLKLLFYSDFHYYKNNSISLTGSVYVHLPYGPVPDKYELLIEYLRISGDIDYDYVFFDNGYEACEIKNIRKFDKSIFNDDEMLTLNHVFKTLKDKGSSEISKMSHDETGYINTCDRERINYDYAFDIKSV